LVRAIIRHREDSDMSKVLYEKDRRIGRITLNRPEVLNAIDDDLPLELAAAVAEADADPDVHVMVLAGNGAAFCAGYDLAYYAEKQGGSDVQANSPIRPIWRRVPGR
jgi:enoyl-CoA hydratase